MCFPRQQDDDSHHTATKNHVDESTTGGGHGEADARKDMNKIPMPTSEQLMIAQIVDSSADDPNQRKKIRQVMDITGKEEDEVATALFDAGWDQNKAVELLLEGGGDSMGAWEETTGKKKKKQQKHAEENKVRRALQLKSIFMCRRLTILFVILCRRLVFSHANMTPD